MKHDAAIDVRNVSETVRQAVESDAQARDMSRNDVVVEILAARYGHSWEASGYPYTGGEGSANWVIRMPASLRDTIRAHAESMHGVTQPGVIVMALADHYRLPVPSPRKRVPTKLTPKMVKEARAAHANGESLRSLSRRLGVKRETLTRAIRKGA